MNRIILATTSPYRIKHFKELGLDFIAEGSNVEEYFDGRPNTPKELVQHLAKLKAEAVAENHSQGIIIGFDSVGYFKKKILEKPKSRQESFERLKNFSGESHEFYTGIYMTNLTNQKTLTDVVKTKILFRKLSGDEINKYLDKDKKVFTYALGYDPEHHYSMSFAKRIEGSYNNILSGLPVEKIVEMLKEIGY